MSAWARRTIRTYFGNAAAVRDYRSQLRGNRALYLWASYLGLLILLGGLAYSQIMDQQYSRSLAELQRELNQFYSMVVGMIAAVVCLVAPALTASSITSERLRRSLDLVFSAPVEPRYLLVGKMIASMRYLVMLLVLALPVMAVCVVMGGATWSDVIGSSIVLLSSGIVFMAVGLAVSSHAQTVISAIFNSYAAVGAYLWFTASFGLVFAAGRMFGGPFGGSSTNEAPWSVVLLPFTASISAPTFTTVYGVEVPNWIFGLIFAVAIAKLLLSAAGSHLSPFCSPETLSLRIHGLVFAVVLTLLMAFPMVSAGSMLATAITGGASAGGTGSSGHYEFGIIVAGACICAFWLIPQLACFASDADRKYQPNGLFSLRAAFRGTPAGGLPYILMLWAAPVATFAVVYGLSKRDMLGYDFWSLSAWGLGFLIFWWGVGRALSGYGMGLKSARTSVIAAGIVLLALPLPILSVLSFSAGTQSSAIWSVHMCYPLMPGTSYYGLPYGIAFAIAGLTLAFAGESNLKATMIRRRNTT